MKQRKREAFLRDLSFVCSPRLLISNPNTGLEKVTDNFIGRLGTSLDDCDVLSEQSIVSLQQQSLEGRTDSALFGPVDLMITQCTERDKDQALHVNGARNSSNYSSDKWEESEMETSCSCSLESPGSGKKHVESSCLLTLEEAAAAIAGTTINETSFKCQKKMESDSHIGELDGFCDNESIDRIKESKRSGMVSETMYEQQLAIILEEIKCHKERGFRVYR
mmetsp:Transcript_19574/g.18913  ORF Transcript_19574/g.18913 Transcript_19574/m.18913 type:complete len:221 (-) Transcript_19574:688-1350(-)